MGDVAPEHSTFGEQLTWTFFPQKMQQAPLIEHPSGVPNSAGMLTL
jgi:hypothetical protein